MSQQSLYKSRHYGASVLAKPEVDYTDKKIMAKIPMIKSLDELQRNLSDPLFQTLIQVKRAILHFHLNKMSAA